MRAIAQGNPETMQPPPVGTGDGRPAVAEERSLHELFAAEESPLLRYAHGLTGDREAAEDLVQEAFLRLHQHWAEVRQPRPWLYRCVRNLAMNHLRKRNHEAPLGSEEEWGDGARSVDGQLARLEAMGALQSLMAELREDDRRLLDLKYREDLKYDQIAERTGMNSGTVGYKLHHLLKGLADSLRRMGIESADG
jgi:RNA polymerase sigma-70 factor (ECF subfamily)